MHIYKQLGLVTEMRLLASKQNYTMCEIHGKYETCTLANLICYKK